MGGRSFRRRVLWFVVVVLSMISLVGLVAPAQAQNDNSLILVGDAARLSDRLRLTSNQFSQLGAAWSRAQYPVGGGFVLTFQFQITDPINGGADGIAFIVQNVGSNTVLQGGGGGLGYNGLFNSLAVEFDTFENVAGDFEIPGGVGDPNDNHVSVQTAGTGVNSPDTLFSLGFSTDIPNLSDGQVHIARITYAPAVMQIFIDDLSVPALVVGVDLGASLELSPGGRAFIGFAGATGEAAENHDILSFRFIPTSAPRFAVEFGV